MIDIGGAETKLFLTLKAPPLRTSYDDGTRIPWPWQELTLHCSHPTPFVGRTLPLPQRANYHWTILWTLQGGIVHLPSLGIIRNPSRQTRVTTPWRLTTNKPASSVHLGDKLAISFLKFGVEILSIACSLPHLSLSFETLVVFRSNQIRHDAELYN